MPPTKPSHVLFGLTAGAILWRPNELAPDVLQDVAALHHDDQEEEQLGAARPRSRRCWSVSSAGT